MKLCIVKAGNQAIASWAVWGDDFETTCERLANRILGGDHPVGGGFEVMEVEITQHVKLTQTVTREDLDLND